MTRVGKSTLFQMFGLHPDGYEDADSGWRVVRIWEHALPRLNAKGQRLKQNRLLRRIRRVLNR